MSNHINVLIRNYHDFLMEIIQPFLVSINQVLVYVDHVILLFDLQVEPSNPQFYLYLEWVVLLILKVLEED